MTEIWKDIKGYEGHYKISNFGRIYSQDQYVPCGNGKGYMRFIPGKFLKILTASNGYPSIGLFKNRKVKVFRIHRLIASAFIPNPEDKPHINHKNANKSDNSLENLEWCTQSENMRHMVKMGRANRASQEKAIFQIDLNGNLIQEWKSGRLASRELKIGQRNLSKCLRGRAKTAYGFIWKFK